MVRVADATKYPGHCEWLRREEEIQALRGFSLLVKCGQVSALYAASVLNPAHDGQLETRYIRQIEKAVPLAPDFQILRY